ncbi:MAG: DUF1232 domain-containing protein [Sphingobacteriales bacterium]|nr:MAG: DUF1232 domain-containing protein [Sphingobacteriales bacterium]
MANKNQTHKKKTGATLDEILGSPIFNRITEQAKEYSKNPASVIRVLGNVTKKIDKGALAELKDGVYILARMIKAVVKKQYTHLPTSTLARVIGAMLYFLFIADLIPDFIPVLGLMDDAAVLAWVINSVKGDLEKFQEWEDEREAKQNKQLAQ